MLFICLEGEGRMVSGCTFFMFSTLSFNISVRKLSIRHTPHHATAGSACNNAKKKRQEEKLDCGKGVKPSVPIMAMEALIGEEE